MNIDPVKHVWQIDLSGSDRTTLIFGKTVTVVSDGSDVGKAMPSIHTPRGIEAIRVVGRCGPMIQLALLDSLPKYSDLITDRDTIAQVLCGRAVVMGMPEWFQWDAGAVARLKAYASLPILWPGHVYGSNAQVDPSCFAMVWLADHAARKLVVGPFREEA